MPTPMRCVSPCPQPTRVRFVGLPEGYLPMSQAAIYLAVAPKSNSSLTTYSAAKRDVEQFGALPVPMHLRNASSGLSKSLGFGQGYQYPHNVEGNYVVENYLPDELRGRSLLRAVEIGPGTRHR
jgi:putative ATPase